MSAFYFLIIEKNIEIIMKVIDCLKSDILEQVLLHFLILFYTYSSFELIKHLNPIVGIHTNTDLCNE